MTLQPTPCSHRRSTGLARNRPLGAKAPSYDPEFAALQQAAYSDIRPLILNRDATEVVELVGQSLRRLRMRVVQEVAPQERRGSVGFVEAVDRTLVLGFHDDVIVRVTDLGRTARVDVRSASRYGRHDLGLGFQKCWSLNRFFKPAGVGVGFSKLLESESGVGILKNLPTQQPCPQGQDL